MMNDNPRDYIAGFFERPKPKHLDNKELFRRSAKEIQAILLAAGVSIDRFVKEAHTYNEKAFRLYGQAEQAARAIISPEDQELREKGLQYERATQAFTRAAFLGMLIADVPARRLEDERAAQLFDVSGNAEKIASQSDVDPAQRLGVAAKNAIGYHGVLNAMPVLDEWITELASPDPEAPDSSYELYGQVGLLLVLTNVAKQDNQQIAEALEYVKKGNFTIGDVTGES